MKVTRFATAVLAVALLALVASDAFAQQPGRRGGGQGGPGGFGGRGGGPGGPGGFGGRGGGDMTLSLLQMEPVQTELQIGPDQQEAIGKLVEQSRGERPDRSQFENMTDDERRQFFEQRQSEAAARAAQTKEKLEEVLLPEQMERLDQIALQLRGVGALNDDDIAGKLKITAEQKEKLQQVQEEQRSKMGEKMRELFSSGDRENMREAFGKLREEMEEAVLAVLTSEQRSQFDEMKGDEFEMPEGFGRGGFGGPGGGRGGFGGGPGGGRGGFGGGPGGGGRPGGRGGRPPIEE